MALLGNMISAVAGRTLARTVGGVAAGPAGAVIGMALPFVARRLGPMGMIGMAVGAWAIGRILKDQADKDAAEAAAELPVTIDVKAGDVKTAT